MNTPQRKRYFTDLWPAACAAQGWDPKDDQRRHAVTLYATGMESTTGLQEHQVTALFTYLAHLADLTSVEKAAAWAECQRDPVAFNNLRQARYWERRAGYRGGGRLHRQRFHNHVPEGPFDPSMPRAETDQLLMTARERARSKAKARRVAAAVAEVPLENQPF